MVSCLYPSPLEMFEDRPKYVHLKVSNGQQGVKKISKIVINGSILILKYAVERLDKNKHFQNKKLQKKDCKKSRMGC